ncbi:MAG: hypothetical protein KAS66_08350 [Candidatus Omnitrophica bacterium]|nr:hypothetical protein [Candidatus Omnitrophota bacterium]
MKITSKVVTIKLTQEELDRIRDRGHIEINTSTYWPMQQAEIILIELGE